jgi:hypothetical protein
MVKHTNQILDAGQIKICPEVKMTNECDRLDKLIQRSQMEYITPDPVWDSDEEEYFTGNEIINPDYKPATNIVRKWIDTDYESEADRPIYLHPDVRQLKGKKGRDTAKMKFLADANLKKSLYGFLGLIPFNPCVMINISPNWKGKVDPKDYHWQALLADTIQTYLKSCDRYTKWQYCLECGGDGDFLHAHIVAEINPAIHKSVLTHINKGNHKYEIIKAFKKMKGDEGLLKGKFAIQRILLNTETLRDDKLKYLIETNKPDGHQNKYDMDLVVGDFNTSKE